MLPNAREMTLPTVLRSDWLIVPTRPRKSALNRTCSNFWIVRLTRFRDTRVRSDSLPHDTIYSVARQSGVFLRVSCTVWRGLKETAEHIAPIITHIFQQSYNTTNSPTTGFKHWLPQSTRKALNQTLLTTDPSH